MNQLLDAARVALCLVFLLYASWSDYKSREVSNRVWAVFGPTALALTAFQFLFFSPDLLITYFLSFAVTSVLAIVIFYVGGFGGADAKALMCIALALPIYPANLLPQPEGFISPLFPLTIFTNSVLLGALSVFYALLRNLLWKMRHGKLFQGLESEPFSRKGLALLSGYKVPLSKLERGFMFPLEDIESGEGGKGRRRLMVFPKDEGREEIIARIRKNVDRNVLELGVWATPGLPLLIFVTAGLIIALLYGDIVWILLSQILT